MPALGSSNEGAGSLWKPQPPGLATGGGSCKPVMAMAMAVPPLTFLSLSHQGKPGARGLPGPPGQLGPEVSRSGPAPARPRQPPACSILVLEAWAGGLSQYTAQAALGPPSSSSLTALLCHLSRDPPRPGLPPLHPSSPSPGVASFIGASMWEGRNCRLRLTSEALHLAGVARRLSAPCQWPAGPGFKPRRLEPKALNTET